MRYDHCWVKANAPYKPDHAFLKQLHYLRDGRLRVRWSQREQRWAIELQIARPIEYVTSLQPYIKTRRNGVMVEVENDSWHRARDGYILVGYCDPQPRLGDALIHTLRFGDVERLGGADAINLLMTRAEERKRDLLDRQHKTERHNLFDEVYEDLKWRLGERVAVPKTYQH